MVEPVRPGVWATLNVEVIRLSDNAVVGSYARNYSTMMRTFFAFARNGREFALYSPDYTGTRIMGLPSCLDLGGEERAGGGFCPVDYFVPADPNTGEALDVGFVAGCVWGDDSSWKIQAIDLSEIEAGRLARDTRFGYLELPDGLALADVIVVHAHDPEAGFEGFWIEVKTSLRFDLATGKQLTSIDL